MPNNFPCSLILWSIVAAVIQTGSVGGQQSRAALLSQFDHLEVIRQSIPLLRNRTLRVCVVVREPFVIYREPARWAGSEFGSLSPAMREAAKEDLDNYSGVAIAIIKQLVTIFGLNIRIIRPKDGQFGILTRDGSWTGLMGSLVRNESDIGVTALSITITRAQVIDFTRAYYVETAAILLRTPEEVKNYVAIFEPFSMGAWLLLLATIVLLILLITIMTKLEESQRQQYRLHQLAKFLDQNEPVPAEAPAGVVLRGHHRRRQTTVEEFSRDLAHRLTALSEAKERQEFGSTWLDRFYYATKCVINILLIRDIKHPPSQTPIRILVCVWWLSTTVIVNIYFGILFGQLVVPRRPRAIETLEELVNQNQVSWAVTSGSALHELFRRAPKDTVYGQLGARMNNVTSADAGLARVMGSGWAFIRERSILTFKVAQEHNRLRACRMQLAREEFFSVGFGLGLTKGSPYLRPFNSALTLMIEGGFVARWQSMYWPTRNQYTECQLEPLREGEPLSMKHFISIYLVCSLIIGLALVILVYQNLHERQLKPMLAQLKHRVRPSSS